MLAFTRPFMQEQQQQQSSIDRAVEEVPELAGSGEAFEADVMPEEVEGSLEQSAEPTFQLYNMPNRH